MTKRTTVSRALCLSVAVISLFFSSTKASADATIGGLDALILNPAYNDNPGGDLFQFGAFSGAVAYNGFDSFTIDTGAGGGDAFGGVGARIAGEFGTTFDPANYKLEFSYKLGPNNAADSLHVVMSQHDGVDGGGLAQGEDFTFRFNDLLTNGNTSTFTTATRELTLLPNPVTGSVFDPWDVRAQTNFFPNDGDIAQDYNVNGTGFEDGNPNGLWRMQVQSIFGGTERVDVEIKDVRLVPIAAEPEVVRFDGNTGHAREADFYVGNVDRDGANILIDGTTASPFVSGFGFTSMKNPVTSFDGNAYMIEIKAKLGATNTMPGVSVILKDLDGNDDAAGQGAEEWAYFFQEGDLNTSTFTTLTRAISLPDTGAPSNVTANGFTNAGDGSFADFDLYQMFIANAYGPSTPDPAARLDIEIESIKIIPLVVEDADFDGNGSIDGADFLAWQGGFGSASPLLSDGDANGDGFVDAVDLGIWETQYGTSSPLSAAVAAPEPGSLALVLIGLFCFTRGRATVIRIS